MNLKYYLRGLGIGIAVTTLIMAFSFNNNAPKELTDAEIIAKAENLGMVMEDKVLLKQSSEDASEAETSEEEKSGDEAEEAIQMAPEDNSDSLTEEETDASKEDDTDSKKDESDSLEKAKAEEEAKKKAEEEAKKKAEEEAKKKAEEEAKKKAEEEAKKKAEEEAKKKAETATNTQASIPVNGTIIIINVKPGSGSETVSSQLYKAGLVDSATSFNAYLCSGGYDRRLTTGDHSVPMGSTYAEIAKIMTSSKR